MSYRAHKPARREVLRGDQGGPEFIARGLSRIDAARRGAFSSDLSPAGTALTARVGARAVAQVMGACVYSIGVSGAPVLGDPGYLEFYGRQPRSGPVMFEMQRVSGAYNSARQTALTRMAAQATRAKANVVLGVQIGLTEHESSDMRTVEFLATGTALRLDHGPPVDQPSLAALSASDYYCLREAGYEPVGIAAATSIYYVRPSVDTARAMTKRRRAAPPNQELADFSAAATAARATCETRMHDQATKLSGTGIVAISLELQHSLSAGLTAEEPRSTTQRRGNLHVTAHGLGTIVQPRPQADTAGAHPPVRPVLWLT